MKSTFSLLMLLFSIVSSLAIISCQQVNSKPTENKALVKNIENVKAITKMGDELKRIDADQLGICDTCVAGFKSAIFENRLLAQELVKQNIRMKQALDSNNVEIQKIQDLHALNKKRREGYEIRYALANSQ